MNIKILYTPEQKREWFGDGEWVNEPDEIIFEHEGYHCYIKRVAGQDGPNSVYGGHLCGYVYIPEDHPWYGKRYSDIEADVHGGITYGEFNDHGKWEIGFDCAHSGDYHPSIEKSRKDYHSWFEEMKKTFKDSPLFNPVYRNVPYVIGECKRLAEQAKKLEVEK